MKKTINRNHRRNIFSLIVQPWRPSCRFIVCLSSSIICIFAKLDKISNVLHAWNERKKGKTNLSKQPSNDLTNVDHWKSNRYASKSFYSFETTAKRAKKKNQTTNQMNSSRTKRLQSLVSSNEIQHVNSSIGQISNRIEWNAPNKWIKHSVIFDLTSFSSFYRSNFLFCRLILIGLISSSRTAQQQQQMWTIFLFNHFFTARHFYLTMKWKEFNNKKWNRKTESSNDGRPLHKYDENVSNRSEWNATADDFQLVWCTVAR